MAVGLRPALRAAAWTVLPWDSRYLSAIERSRLILPTETTPHIHGFVTRMGTIEELLAAMRQALATDASLRWSIEHHNALVIQAQVNENGTIYNFRPVRESHLLNN